MSFYDNRYYYINKTLLSIIGQWPFQSRLGSSVMLFLTLFFNCSYAALELWSLIGGITDLNIVIEMVQSLLVHNFVFIKLTNSLYNKNKMKDLLKHIEETWKMTQIETERKIFENYAEKSKTLTIQYTAIMYGMALPYAAMPCVFKGIYFLFPSNETYQASFLFSLEHIMDVDKYINILMIYGIISIFYVITVSIAIDSTYILCIQHGCALFQTICYNIKNVPVSDFGMQEVAKTDDETYHIIVKYMKFYKSTLQYSKLLSSTYSVSNFFLLGNVTLSLSFSAAQLMLVANQLDVVIRIVATNIAQLMHIFYLSLTSQRLIDHSNKLSIAIYSSEWYKSSLRSRQVLRFMLMRANKPCQIKAGKMYVMSLENFGSILQVALSYFTMLRSMQA